MGGASGQASVGGASTDENLNGDGVVLGCGTSVATLVGASVGVLEIAASGWVGVTRPAIDVEGGCDGVTSGSHPVSSRHTMSNTNGLITIRN